MSLLSGFKKAKKYVKQSDGYALLSQWTSSNTVEMDDGSSLETKMMTKAPIADPAFTGTPTAPTPSANVNTEQIATAAFVQTVVSNHDISSTAHSDIRDLISDDRQKLNSIAFGAEVNQNAFSNIIIGDTTMPAGNETDSLTFAGSNITLTPDSADNKITIGMTKENIVSALGYTPGASTITLATPSELGGIMVNANYNPTDSASGAIVDARNPRQTFTVNNQLFAEGYSTGTNTTAGITKLYTETGENTDGTMTQAAITNALSGKADSVHGHAQLKGGDYTVNLATAGLPNSVKSLFSSDSSICLGWSQMKWGQIYSTASTISTSDRNRKHNISYIGETSAYSDTALTDEKLEQLVMGIKPAVYKFDDGTSNRPHHGIISQDFEQLLQVLNIDHAAFIKSPKMVQRCDTEGNPVTDEDGNVIWDEVEGEYEYGFRYEELILDILRFAQLQKKRADSLEERIESIETKLA